MRIGIDARFFGGEQSKGLGRYTQKLIEHLAQQDDHNEYVIFLQADSFDKWTIDNPRFTPMLAPYTWYTVEEQLKMPRMIREAEVDLMHFPHFNVPLLYRGPFVVTIHDLIILRFPTQRATTLGSLKYFMKHTAGKMVMNHAAKRSQHIITVSHFSKNDIVDYFAVPGEKISVTYEAAEPLSGEEAPTEEVLQKYGIADTPYVLYVGNAYPHKHLEVLVDTAKQLQQQGATQRKFVLVGKVDYFYERLQRMIADAGVEDLFVCTDFVPDADLPVLYKNAQAYIFPSLYEGFGLPPLEAMHYGVPVIAARASCLPEILGDGALYFDSNDISGIITALDTVENDAAARSALIARGRETVQQYSWSSMTEQTLAVYEQFAKKTHTQG